MKRSKLVQQRPTLPFAWRPSQLRKYQDCMPARARNWLVERKDSALLISNSTIQSISYGFVGILSSLFCSNHLLGRHYRGRQTVENHLIHTGTNSYRIMTSSILSWFIFSRFIFSRKQVCWQKSRKFAPSENSRYTVSSCVT